MFCLSNAFGGALITAWKSALSRASLYTRVKYHKNTANTSQKTLKMFFENFQHACSFLIHSVALKQQKSISVEKKTEVPHPLGAQSAVASSEDV